MGKKTMTQVVTRAQHSGQGAAGLHVQLDAHGYDRGSKQLGSVIISWLFQGPFAKVERREDQLEVFLKYARRFGVPEVIYPQHPFLFVFIRINIPIPDQAPVFYFVFAHWYYLPLPPTPRSSSSTPRGTCSPWETFRGSLAAWQSWHNWWFVVVYIQFLFMVLQGLFTLEYSLPKTDNLTGTVTWLTYWVPDWMTDGKSCNYS